MKEETKFYIKQGFSYTSSYKKRGTQLMIEFSVQYQDDINIFYQLINQRIDTEILFQNVCKSYIRDTKLNYLGI